MMNIALIPAPEKIVYKSGFTNAETEIKTEIDNAVPAEGFAMDIDGGITLRASSDAGFFYARGALEQIKFQCGGQIPNVHIEDSPRFSYRSFMLDSCRHFISVEDIKKMIAYCSKLRFNVFHWHLTDDQGWRPEIGCRPELIKIGSVRKGNHFGAEQNEEIHSGYYTKEEMKDIVSFAHKNHMSVVPEFDMPGHASALLKSIPELACRGKKVEIKTKPGIFKDIICAGNEKTYETLFLILDELCEIFTDEYIHLGGDEAPKQQWKSCPECQKAIADEGLKNEDELQGLFINRITKHLAQKGKKVITWNESLKGGNLDKSVTVQMWMDPSHLSVKSQNKIINSDFFHYYADYPYSMTPLKKVYCYDPMVNENVIGVDAPIWTEYIDNIKRMEYMCFPRFIAAAQTAWSKNKPPYAVFKKETADLIPYFGTEYAAKTEEWDPKAYKRLPGIISHFGSVSPSEKARKIFAKNDSAEKN